MSTETEAFAGEPPAHVEELVFESQMVTGELGNVLSDMQAMYSYFGRILEGELENESVKEVFEEFVERLKYGEMDEEEVDTYVGRLAANGAFRDIGRQADYHRIDPEYQLEIKAIESGSVVLAVMAGMALLGVTVIAFNKLGIPSESSSADKRHEADDVETVAERTASYTNRPSKGEAEASFNTDD